MRQARSFLWLVVLTVFSCALITPLAWAQSEIVIDATPGPNSLSSSNSGFGDSNQTDRPIPFNFNYSPMSVTRAVIRFRVKPIGQLIGTDTLILKGASGQGNVVYDQFSSLPANAWSTVDVDLSDNKDVMNAIQSGTLEGLLQDDTAVEFVRLILTPGGSPPGGVTPFRVVDGTMTPDFTDVNGKCVTDPTPRNAFTPVDEFAILWVDVTGDYQGEALL